MIDALVSVEWLAGALGAPDLRVLDASYHALDPARDPAAEFAAGHVPGARFLDLAGLADPASDLPAMLPPPALFAERLGALGVAAGDRIVLYDDAPHRTAARAWWMLRAFGARDVAILDGGWQAWQAAGRAIEQGSAAAAPVRFEARQDASAVRDLAAVRANLASAAEQLVDARSVARFEGSEADPRSGIAAGHIPGSRSLPYARLLGPDGRFKGKDAIRAEFAQAGVDLARPLVATCGSGITAAVLAFGAHLIGKEDVALYDGSWSEWGGRADTPKALGPA